MELKKPEVRYDNEEHIRTEMRFKSPRIKAQMEKSLEHCSSLVGQRSGRLFVESFYRKKESTDDWIKYPKGYRSYYLLNCLCDCGNFIDIIKANFVTGNAKSCGCLSRDLLEKRANSFHKVNYIPENLIKAIDNIPIEKLKDIPVKKNVNLSKPSDDINRYVEFLKDEFMFNEVVPYSVIREKLSKMNGFSERLNYEARLHLGIKAHTLPIPPNYVYVWAVDGADTDKYIKSCQELSSVVKSVEKKEPKKELESKESGKIYVHKLKMAIDLLKSVFSDSNKISVDVIKSKADALNLEMNWISIAAQNLEIKTCISEDDKTVYFVCKGEYLDSDAAKKEEPTKEVKVVIDDEPVRKIKKEVKIIKKSNNVKSVPIFKKSKIELTSKSKHVKKKGIKRKQRLKMIKEAKSCIGKTYGRNKITEVVGYRKSHLIVMVECSCGLSGPRAVHFTGLISERFSGCRKCGGMNTLPSGERGIFTVNNTPSTFINPESGLAKIKMEGHPLPRMVGRRADEGFMYKSIKFIKKLIGLGE